MKKLYKIIVTHYAPKDSHSSIQEYVVAENDKEVFDYLANGYAYWNEILEDYDGDGEEECREAYDEILSNKGDDRDVCDLYYGATQYAWEEVELTETNEARTSNMIIAMIENGIAKDISKEVK